MRQSGFTFPLPCPLSYTQTALISLEGLIHIDLYQFFCFLNIDLDQFLSNQFHHLGSLLLLFNSNGIVESILQNVNCLLSFFSLVVALPEA